MTFGVMSDTHGNIGFLFAAADLMRDPFNAECIIHAGDDYDDAQHLVEAGYAVHCVPGLWCGAYRTKAIPNRWVRNIGGIAVACAHAEQDLTAHERAAALIITGHTHVALVEKRGRAVYLNPGHLKRATDRSQPASFAIVTTSVDDIAVDIRERDGALREAHTFRRDDLG